jgi:hypothetical protein
MDKSGKHQNYRTFRVEFLKKPAFFVIILPFLLLPGACGIEDYPYLEPVREDSITWVLNNEARILLPYVTSQQFTHFAIYYRIYISGEPRENRILPADMSAINSAMDQDYRAFLPYTNTDNTSVSTQIGTLFSIRKYYSLYTSSADINDLLSNPAIMGQPIVIDFAPVSGRPPTIKIGGADYVLLRTTGKGISGSSDFEIKHDDRTFINTSELNSSEYAASTNTAVNNDVADKAVSGFRYTYVSMYIVAAGHDLITYNPIYSQPAYIGVFRLPEP